MSKELRKPSDDIFNNAFIKKLHYYRSEGSKKFKLTQAVIDKAYDNVDLFESEKPPTKRSKY